jgi:hypothetical protein
MLLVKITNGEVDQYPYTLNDLRREHSHTSFPKTVSEETLAEYGVYVVTVPAQPSYDHLVQSPVLSTVPYLDVDNWKLSYTVENKSQELAEKNIRDKRNQLLSATDWMATTDNTLSDEVTVYRQALRDITSQTGFPYEVIWPTIAGSN